MSKIVEYYLIDNNENKLFFYYASSRNTKADGVLSQCVKFNYNVTADKILNFRWGTVEWDYAQIILGDVFGGLPNVVGFRMVLKSKFLNAYYTIKSLLEKQSELLSHCNLIIDDWNFDIKYEVVYNGYSVTLDIIPKRYEINEGRKGTLFGKYKSDNI